MKNFLQDFGAKTCESTFLAFWVFGNSVKDTPKLRTLAPQKQPIGFAHAINALWQRYITHFSPKQIAS